MSIKKLHNGKFFLYTIDGRGRKVRIRFEKREDAEALEAILKKQRYENKLIGVGLRKSRYLFNDLLDDFEITKSKLRPKSVQKYKAIIKQIRFFAEKHGITYIDEFTSDHGIKFYNALVKETTAIKDGEVIKVSAAPKTINFYLQTLKSFFQEEVIKDHIQKSPVIVLKNIRVEKKKPEFYTTEELKKIFSQEMPLAYRNFFLGLLYSGMRFSEAANLSWSDIDFTKKLVMVRSKPHHKLKSSSSERAIPMNEVFYELLSDLSRDKKSDLYVFTTTRGTQMKERSALTECKNVAESAGINARAFLHKFRATYATWLIRNKTSLESIKELLGHASFTETEKSYANNESAYLHKEVASLDDILK